MTRRLSCSGLQDIPRIPLENKAILSVFDSTDRLRPPSQTRDQGKVRRSWRPWRRGGSILRHFDSGLPAASSLAAARCALPCPGPAKLGHWEIGEGLRTAVSPKPRLVVRGFRSAVASAIFVMYKECDCQEFRAASGETGLAWCSAPGRRCAARASDFSCVTTKAVSGPLSPRSNSYSPRAWDNPADRGSGGEGTPLPGAGQRAFDVPGLVVDDPPKPSRAG